MKGCIPPPVEVWATRLPTIIRLPEVIRQCYTLQTSLLPVPPAGIERQMALGYLGLRVTLFEQ